jgi:hypothetical protein
MSKTLLVVHHTPSPATRELLEAVFTGAKDPEIDGVDLVVRPALAATVPDMLDADGYIFGTTANLGYMSGALKHYLVGYPGFGAASAASANRPTHRRHTRRECLRRRWPVRPTPRSRAWTSCGDPRSPCHRAMCLRPTATCSASAPSGC